MTSEQCKKKLLELSQSPGNERCADCGSTNPPPDFVSLNLGLFVCIKCSGIHRSMGVQVSVIKSIHLDTFDAEKCYAMERAGNISGAAKWEHSVPACWPEVKSTSYEDIIEQWIHAKYERLEFAEGFSDKQLYAIGAKYGWLIKKEKEGTKWNKRFFVLTAKEGYLSYFIKQEDGEPKQRIHVSNLNVMLMPEEFTKRKHSLLITFPYNRNGYAKERHIYVYSETSFESVDWYLAIRAARLKFLEPNLHGVEKPVVDFVLSRSYIKMGFLLKTGSKKGDSWKLRFVCIDLHRFIYFQKPTDPEPLGEVSIQNNEMNCLILEGTDGSHPKAPTKHCFMIRVQKLQNNRKPVFNFCAESRAEMLQWIAAFHKAMKPLEWMEPIKDHARQMSLLSNISSNYYSVAAK